MRHLFLHYFTKNTRFRFFVQYGTHKEPMPLHTHDDFVELVLVLSGSADHRVNNEVYRIQKGDVFVIHHNTYHGYENPKNFRLYNIMYQPEQLQAYTDLKQMAGFHALFVIEPYLINERASFNSHYRLTEQQFDKAAQVISDMLREFMTKSPGYQTWVLAKFMELVVYLSREYEAETAQPVTLPLANAVSYMENHFRNEITSEQLAQISGLSLRHFTRVFKEVYQVSPIQYLISLRMEYACTLLQTTLQSITEVAYESGFHDSNYFSKQFKREFGITPLQYRKQRNLEWNHERGE